MKKIFRELKASAESSFIVKQEKGKQFSAPYHFHHGYEFTYLVQGQGKFYGGNRLMNFKAGDMYLFGPGFAHYFVNDIALIKSGTLAHSIVVQFEEELTIREFFLRPEFKEVKTLLMTAHLGIKITMCTERVKELMWALTEQSGLKALILFIQLLEVISTLPKKSISVISQSKYERPLNFNTPNKIEVVYQYVLENFKDNVTTKKAALLANMNEGAFCRYFKRRTKKTLSQFLNNIRITHAAYLLEQHDASISEVCYECGFNNLSYFNRQFKAIMKKSPLHYRKTNSFVAN